LQALLAGLAFDPAGGMWLNYSQPDLVARVNPDLSVDEYPIPTQNAVMHRIIEGPDHNSLWFTELAGDEIGTLDPNQLPRPPTSG
jgi:streptogramin lyase